MTPDGCPGGDQPYALEVGGLRSQDVIGKTLDETGWFSYKPEVQQQLREDIRRAQAGEIVRRDIEMRIANGGLMTADCMLVPVLDTKGRVVK